MTLSYSPKRSQGSALIEAMIAMVIFSVGALSLITLQAVSVRDELNARIRNQASLLAQDLSGVIYANQKEALAGCFITAGNPHNSTDCTAASSGAITAWTNRVKNELNTPKGDTWKCQSDSLNGGNQVAVTSTQLTNGTNTSAKSTRYDITVRWVLAQQDCIDARQVQSSVIVSY